MRGELNSSSLQIVRASAMLSFASALLSLPAPAPRVCKCGTVSTGRQLEKENVMIAKITSLLIAALLLSSASIASAATVKRAIKHPVHHGTVFLLENRPHYSTPARNFQDNFAIDY